MSNRHLKFFSHINEDTYRLGPDLKIGRRIVPKFASATVAKVRADEGYQVRSFAELVRCIAELGSRNSRFNLLFRGQGNDHRDRNGRTKLYPSIYRPHVPNGQLRVARLKLRLKKLRNLISALSEKRHNLGLSGHLLRHQEYWEAIIQHYDLCPTRLLDVTQSLRVAATFALFDTRSGHSRQEGFLFVFGFPHPTGSISTYADEELVLVKLQNVCPPEACRPHFQEGFLVGRWPRTESKDPEANFGYWLLAKYRLINQDNTFFGPQFPPIPYEALFPKDDPFHKQLLQTKDDLADRDRGDIV